MKFSFVGKVPSSKSLMNRALVLQSFAPHLSIVGASQCDDVVLMHKALQDFSQGKTEFECGSAGTVFRFLALRVSKKPGQYYLKADFQLLNRPQGELVKLLSQLSCSAIFDSKGLKITSRGWKLMGDGIHISAKQSSQFISSFLLSAWGLDFPCCISLGENIFSESYLKMTINLCKNQGMTINYNEKKPYEIYIPKKQNLNLTSIVLEPDMSSVFALAAIALVSGYIQITDFPQNSIQGDGEFVNHLKDIGGEVDRKISNEGVCTLSVKESSIFKTHFSGHLFTQSLKRGFSLSLKSTPDLFPVLTALACLLTGKSVFQDISHIAHKESNRLKEMQTLLSLLGRETKLETNTFTVKPWNQTEASPAWGKKITFDVKKDHRLVMAVYVLKAAGFNIHCLGEKAVTKSFPEFLSLIKNFS